MTTKTKCLDLELLPNEQQADVLARSADACGKIRRTVSQLARKAEAEDVPEDLLYQAFMDALEDAAMAPGKALEELNGFCSVYPELAMVDPRVRQVRLVDFPDAVGTLPCRKFKGSQAIIENVFVFRDAAAKWHAKVLFEA